MRAEEIVMHGVRSGRARRQISMATKKTPDARPGVARKDFAPLGTMGPVTFGCDTFEVVRTDTIPEQLEERLLRVARELMVDRAMAKTTSERDRYGSMLIEVTQQLVELYRLCPELVPEDGLWPVDK